VEEEVGEKDGMETASDVAMMDEYSTEYVEEGQVPSPTSVHSDIVVHEPISESLTENSRVVMGAQGELVTGELRSKSEPSSPAALGTEEGESPLRVSAATERRGDITP